MRSSNHFGIWLKILPVMLLVALIQSYSAWASDIPGKLSGHTHTTMNITEDYLEELELQKVLAPTYKAPLTRRKDASAAYLNLLDELPGIWNNRDQGSYGTCWIYPSLTAVEMELKSKYNIESRLSVTYISSNRLNESGNWIGDTGGSVYAFEDIINAKLHMLVEMNNANADEFVIMIYEPYEIKQAETLGMCGKSYYNQVGDDSSPLQASPINDYSPLTVGPKHSVVNPNSIGTYPNFPMSVTAKRIETYKDSAGQLVSESQAIENIKAALDSQKVVYFAFTMAKQNAWNAFNDFWDKDSETELFPFDNYLYESWDDGGAGHAVAIVGYDTRDSDASKHYWIAINSWGTSTNRPKGLFAIPMNLNYAGYYNYSNGNNYLSYDFAVIDISADIPTPNAPEITTLDINAFKTGESGDFSVYLRGSGPMQYQWNFNGDPVENQTSASTYFLYADDSLRGTWSVDLSNGTGSITSSPQSVHIAGTQILKNPQFEDGNTGWETTATQGEVITTHSYNCGNSVCGSSRTGSYYLLFSGEKSPNTKACQQTVTIPENSSAATLSYWIKIVNFDTTVPPKDTVLLQLIDSDGNTLQTFRRYSGLDSTWARFYRFDSIDLSSYIGKTITIRFKGIQTSGNGSSIYSVFMIDDIALDVQTPSSGPVITTQPENLKIPVGMDALFTVSSTDASNYGWRKNGRRIWSANSATCGISNVKLEDQGNYYVVTDNTGGATFSKQVSLTVTMDLDHDGVEDVFDMAIMAQAYNSTDQAKVKYSDVYGDGKIDDTDVDLFTFLLELR